MVMASSSSCSSPSSSAVTIPVPGKSILKRPPPAQTGILSRIKGFLPTQPSVSPSDDIKPLKRAHFILPQLAVIYPFSSVNPPSTPALKDEKKAIEDHEAERRKRIVRGNSIGPNETEEWWSLDKVESFYRECCTSREEEPDPAVSAAFKVSIYPIACITTVVLRLCAMHSVRLPQILVLLTCRASSSHPPLLPSSLTC